MITEQQLEDLCIEWFGALGWAYTQITITGTKQPRRADLVAFVNGLLLNEFPKTTNASLSLTDFGAFAGWEAWALWPQK